MQNTVMQHLAGVPDGRARSNLQRLLRPIADRLSCQTLTSAAIRIKGGSASATAQTNAASVYSVQGKLVTLATATDLPALAGTVTNATFNVFAFFIDAAGTRTSAMGVAGSTLAAVKFPPIPEGKTTIGFVIVNPTGTGDFTGGTTALDDATVAPNAVFVNTVGAWDPSIQLG